MTLDCDVADTGLPVKAGTGGSFRVYCERDCAEWGRHQDTRDHGGWPSETDVADYVRDVQQATKGGAV